VTLALASLLLAVAGQWWLGVYAFAPLLWLAALVLFARQLRDPLARMPPAAPLPASVELIAVALILVLAIFFRVYRLDLIPSGLNHDVAWNGLYALRILRGEPYTPYTAEAWGRETTMFYLQALGIRLFGVEMPALIYPAVIAGIALLPLFYLWQREMFGPRLALAGAFLLAVSGWHLVFSRIGWRAVLQPLVSVLAYWLFARAARTRSTLAFCAAGAAAAAAIYTYNAARLLPLLFPLFALCALALAPDRRAAIARYRRGAVDMSVCFTAVVLPMAYYAFAYWRMWQQRANATYFLDGHTVMDNLTALLKVYMINANGDDFFVDTPVLEWPVAVLFLFGFVRCVSQPRDLRAVFLLLGWLMAAIPAFLSTPNANRMIGTLPFVYAFAALGGEFFYRILRRGLGAANDRRWAWAAVSFAALAGVAAIAATWVQYFGAHRRELPGFYPDATVVGRYARTLLPNYDVWIGGKNFPRETLDYLTYQGGEPRRRSYTWLDDATQAAQMDFAPAGHGAAVILAAEGRAGLTFAQLHRRYPAAEVVELRDWTRDEQVFARALLLSPAVLAAPQQAATPTSLPAVNLRDAKRGSEPGQFLDPRGVAVAPDGTVFVADTGNHRVQVFRPDGGLAALFGERGATPGTFDEPSSIALDGDGNLHIVDTWNHRVQKLDRSGFPLIYYTPPQGFFGPRGIAIADGKVFVTDTGNHVVHVFDTDGLFAGSLGLGEGDGLGELDSPEGVAVTGDGRVWVVDGGNHRLQIFHQNGAVESEITVSGWTGRDVQEAYLVADSEAVILSDPAAGKLWRVTADGRFEEIGSGLRFPGGVALGPGGIYSAERDAGHIAILPHAK